MGGRDERHLIVVGGSGLLGSAVAREARRRGWTVFAPSRDRIDLENPGEIAAAVAGFRPQAVVNAAAFTDVTAAEDPAALARLDAVNHAGPAALASACEFLEVPFVHVSTDYVFDGVSSRPYREDDPVGPLQAYGRSKRDGEVAVLARAGRSIVARTSTLYGPGDGVRTHYVEAILRQAERGGRIEVVEHPVASPTYTPDLAAMLLALIDAGARGIVHAVNDGECSRLDLARAAVQEAGLADRATVTARPESGAGPARPRFAALDVARFEGVTGWRPRHWREALREYVTERLREEAP